MELLKWDSNFFGFVVSKIELFQKDPSRGYLQLQNKNNSTLTYIFTKHMLDEETLSLNGGFLADTKLIFEKRASTRFEDFDSLDVIKEYSTQFSKKRMYQLAFLSGQYSRFNLDPNLSKEKFEEMYRLWVDNSISGEFASKIFVYTFKKDIIGFITLSIKNGIGNIGLIAVDKSHQGKKIGSMLIKKVENYLFNKQTRILRVATQEKNSLAVSFYKKNSFVVTDKIFIYHFWNTEVT